MTTSSITSFDSSLLLNYYQARLNASVLTTTKNMSTSSSSSSSKSTTANDVKPWTLSSPAQLARDTDVLSLTKFLDTSDIPLNAGGTTDSKLEQDNQRLFAIYKAVDNLRYLASMSKRDDVSAAQMAGYNKRFQAGLAEIQSYLKSTTFNNYSLQSATPSSSATGTAKVANAVYQYTGASVVADADMAAPMSGLTASDSFNITVTKAGVPTKVTIDLSKVSGSLTLDNVVGYVNQTLSDNGFTSTFSRVMTKGTIADITNASYGIAINQGAGETLSLSSDSATPSLYLATTSGLTTASGDTAANNQGRLLKLTDLTDPQNGFSQTVTPTDGTSTAQASVVDANGNVYMVGSATGDFGSQLNQGTQDAYLSKYDSAGNLQWTRLLGSAGTASGYSLAVNPNGGVVVAGSTTADVATNAVANGNTDSFVASYGSDGTQTWVKQVQTLNQNQANAVSVDASGNVYIAGNVTGIVGAGQTAVGGQDAYVAKYDSKGTLVSQQQFGTSASDTVSATAVNATGDLFVASVENGEGFVTKYTGGDMTQPAAWRVDVGALQAGGSLSGLAVTSDGQVYLSGSTDNGALNATVANASSGGRDAFVMKLTDSGTSASANYVSYVGTAGKDTGGSLTTSGDGHVYLVGTTAGTFAGNTRSTAGTNNAFVAALSATGSVDWVRQYGGTSGQSSGQGIAIDTQGSSVLDALGLPHGTVTVAQSNTLAASTTLREGDSFKVEVEGTTKRTFTVTIAKNETLQSLATKVSSQLTGKGTAKAAYSTTGKGLQISVNAGVTIKLIAGPTDSDALARLGISPGLITNASTSSSSTKSSSSSSSSSTTAADTQAFGLGLSSTLDISSTTNASHAYANLTAALASIKSIYSKTNSTDTGTSTSGTTNAAQTAAALAQVNSYSVALSLMSSFQSSTTASSSSSIYNALL